MCILERECVSIRFQSILNASWEHLHQASSISDRYLFLPRSTKWRNVYGGRDILSKFSLIFSVSHCKFLPVKTMLGCTKYICNDDLVTFWCLRKHYYTSHHSVLTSPLSLSLPGGGGLAEFCSVYLHLSAVRGLVCAAACMCVCPVHSAMRSYR